MSNKILLDSSILIEYIKGSKTDLLDALLQSNHSLFYNPVIASEYLFHLLAVSANKSPLSVKSSNKIREVLEKESRFVDFLLELSFTELSENDITFSTVLMKDFNLLPNDSLIISNAISKDIKFIATYDADFSVPCKKFDIQIVSEIADLK